MAWPGSKLRRRLRLGFNTPACQEVSARASLILILVRVVACTVDGQDAEAGQWHAALPIDTVWRGITGTHLGISCDGRNEDGLCFFQPMPDVQHFALQHNLTNTIPDLFFNSRASATRVMNPIATESIHKLSAGGHNSAVD